MICKKIVYTDLPLTLTQAPCATYYEPNNDDSGYTCIVACPSLFYDIDKVCGKSFFAQGLDIDEDGAAHACESTLTTLLDATTLAKISKSIRVLHVVTGANAGNYYECIDEYCPSSNPTLSENGICIGEFDNCWVNSAKLLL